jgi:C4-dicarboxylate-specific signal transduction histidine kinase
VISGNAQRLLKGEPDTERGDGLRSILRQTQRLASIIRDLMQFARPANPELTTFPATDLIAWVQDDLEGYARERGVRLELPAIPLHCRLLADAKQIRQALGALTRNGIEAAGTEGWTRIAVRSSGDLVAFDVEDSGPGLNSDAAGHAFDPFYCSRSAGRSRGLGLPTAWRLARQNGGDVRHEARPNFPTRFTLTVPAADEQVGWLERRSA